MNRPLYIFDLDGTLALIEHRLPHIQKSPKDWRSFFAACVDDAPNRPVIQTLQALHQGSDIWVWSGRSNEVETQTRDWLYKNIFRHYELKMRTAGDHRDDAVVKREWAEAMPVEDWARLVATFDDRDRVVAMWRSMGKTCYQVAPGNF